MVMAHMAPMQTQEGWTSNQSCQALQEVLQSIYKHLTAIPTFGATCIISLHDAKHWSGQVSCTLSSAAVQQIRMKHVPP